MADTTPMRDWRELLAEAEDSCKHSYTATPRDVLDELIDAVRALGDKLDPSPAEDAGQ